MSVLDDIRKLIERLAPAPICDDCIAEKLNLTARQNANRHTRELAGQDHIERHKDVCAICGGDKMVTRRLRA
jgi:hypothetical protein